MALAPQHEHEAGLPAFPDPGIEDPSLTAFLTQAADLLGRWWSSSASRPPLPSLSVLAEVAPAVEGLGPQALLDSLQLVMDGAYNPCHPGALAHLDPPPLTASVVADLIAAGLNNNLLAEELSPSLSRLERSLTAWLAERLGLGEGSGGVAASGGSLSNLMALVVARHQAGLQGRQDALVFCSADAHVSIGKALAVMGLPDGALRPLPVDAGGRLQVEALDEGLAAAAAAGRPVLAVVATAGTTVRGAVDPIGPIAALCRRHGVWLHVDGAIGAVFALVPAHASRVPELGLADSLTVNPQKLLGITKTSSLLLLRRPEALARCFATGLPYMEPSWADAHGGECGLQGTRPAEILKLWLGLRQLGLRGIEAVLSGAVQRRQRLQLLLEPLPLELLSGPLHLLAFTPRGLSPQQADQWSARTRQQLLERQLMLSRPLHAGRHHLKAVLGNPHTGDAELQALADGVTASLAPFAAVPSHD
ncbi:MAG: pyridoxal phosphate-dependent decarboxylase family protein [Vulcanococcus sp.]